MLPLALAVMIVVAPKELPDDPFAAGPVLPAGSAAPEAPAPLLEAQGRLRGRVMIMGRPDAVPEASVVIDDATDSVRVTADGHFSVRVPAGEHVVLARAPGYQTLSTPVAVGPGQDVFLELRLLPDLASGVYRTVVREKKQVAISKTTLKEAEIREVPGTQGDPLRVVASLPGVSQVAGFLPYVVVRGAAPGNTGYYLDGSRVPILFHVAIGPSVVHPAFIDAVDFYPSGAPVRLGRYVSGIIEGRTRSGRKDRVHGDLEVRLTDAGAMLEIPFHRPRKKNCVRRLSKKCRDGDARGALTLAGRYSYTSAVLSVAQSDAKIAFWDYQARLDYALGRNADYTAFAYGSFDEVGQKPYTDVDGTRVDPDPFLRFQFHRFDHRIRQRLRGGAEVIYAVVLGVDQTGVSQIKTEEWRVAPRLSVRVPATDNLDIGFGLDQEVQVFRLGTDLDQVDDVQVEDLAYLFADRTVSATGLYLDAAWQKGVFEARPGLRVDFYSQYGNSPYAPEARGVTHAVGVDPRLNLRQQVVPKLALRQTVGMYHQPQSTPIPIPGIENFGFERGLQRNIQGSAGYDLMLLNERVQVSQDVYLGRLSNLQDYDLAAADGGTEIDELEDVITQVTGWAWGLESMVKLAPTLRVFGWAAYTLSWSRRDFPASGPAASNWDQRHIVNVVLGYKIRHKWNVGVRLHYNTGRPWTSPEMDQSQTEALLGNRNNARLPPFFQFDLRVERIWTFSEWQLSGVMDILNASYSREIFACTADGAITDETLPVRQRLVRAMLTPRNGIAKCTPQGFRYIIPSLGLRARF